MISSKSMYSKYFSEYRLSMNQIKELQKTLLEMFIDIKEVCDKYQINYMLSGGTLLGAVRHKGFIPWDDDIDIMMLRKDYERFAAVFQRELAEKYELAEPLSDSKYVSKAPKIFKKGTTYVEVASCGIQKFDMIFIDVFIIENMAEPGLQRKIISKIYDFAFKAASVCVDYKYPSSVIIEKGKVEKDVKEYYTLRRRLGWIFSHVGGMRFYLKLVDKIGKKYKESNWLGVPSAISYNREIFDKKVFTELTEGEFCGIAVKIPKQYDVYLTNLYGDYMELPPENKREVHVAYKLLL